MTGSEVVDLVRRLADEGRTVAVAESLTGGALMAAIVAVPGASGCLRGGVVAYATDLKADLLGVPGDLLEDRGPVDPAVAAAMARGVRERLGADLAVATTGVAGPGPQGGVPAGTFHVAVCDAHRVWLRSSPEGGGADDRAAVRRSACDAALALLAAVVREVGPPGDGGTPAGTGALH